MSDLPTRNWMRIGLWLVGATMAYNVVEAGVALSSGFAAGSIALIGFGLDSVIEFAAASVLLWRLAVEARGAGPAGSATSARRPSQQSPRGGMPRSRGMSGTRRRQSRY